MRLAKTSDIRRECFAEIYRAEYEIAVGVHPWYTNMATGIKCKHLELTLAF